MRALRKVGPRSVVTALAVAGGFGVLRRWSLGYGSTGHERAMPLPGDDHVAEPNLESTRAVTIQASPARVWPWLVQLGQGRGGFYSYTALENLAGAQIRNADHLDPQWQDLAVGDDSCRLVVRERYGYTRRWSALMVEPTELVSFLMSQRMLRGIRDRAERTVAAPSPA